MIIKREQFIESMKIGKTNDAKTEKQTKTCKLTGTPGNRSGT